MGGAIELYLTKQLGFIREKNYYSPQCESSKRLGEGEASGFICMSMSFCTNDSCGQTMLKEHPKSRSQLLV